MDPTLLSGIISGGVTILIFVIGYFITRSKNKDSGYEKVKDDVADQIESFQENLLAQNKLQQTEKKELKVEIGHLQDAIEKLQSRFEAVKSSILTLNLFGNNSPIAMWVKDIDGKRIYHNTAYEILTGYKLADVIGQSDLQITNNLEISQNWQERDERVKSTKAPIFELELANHKNDQKTIFKVVTFKWPVMLQGQVIGIEGAAIRLDVIERILKDEKK
ncbi:MAG: PAS domain-containing protein [Candidatus Izemoplasma sp.]